MKQVTVVFLLAAFFFAATVASFAQEATEAKGSMMDEKMKYCKEMWHKGGMMMKSAKMVATDDDGIVILMGGRLMKYDKDLNLVKEVKIETAQEEQ